MELKDFVFDVLCDFVEPQNCMIDTDRKGNKRVIVLRKPREIPNAMLYDDWKRAIIGTEFENVALFLPKE